ncbi:unnamed protein product [Lactuca saligna]|uniref:Glutamine amidotransferase domain-containing protein n=1 Tax=Lactuca saligna TaxID=75948 RepID=A0AA35ZHJ7_LACSI|nr:unnamed protein product [Lactuca saligna]
MSWISMILYLTHSVELLILRTSMGLQRLRSVRAMVNFRSQQSSSYVAYKETNQGVKPTFNWMPRLWSPLSDFLLPKHDFGDITVTGSRGSPLHHFDSDDTEEEDTLKVKIHFEVMLFRIYIMYFTTCNNQKSRVILADKNKGLAFPQQKLMSLQYHPEASPGPHNSYLG